MNVLFQVFKWMSTIIAKESVETTVSVVKRIASILNETGLTSDKLVSYLNVTHQFIIEYKIVQETLMTQNLLVPLAKVWGC